MWLQLALTAADLVALTQTTLLHGQLALVETKLLRYRLLHTAARIVRHGRQTIIKIAAGWPWADQLAARSPASPPSGNPARLDTPADADHPPPKDPGEPDTRPDDPPCPHQPRSTARGQSAGDQDHLHALPKD